MLPAADDRPEVLLYVVDAGGGHRAAARAITAAAEERHVPWRPETVNLQGVLAPVDFTRRLTGASMEDTYNAMVRRRQTRFLVPLLRSLQWGIRRLHRPLTRTLAADLRRRNPSLVVSLLPNFNAPLRDAVRAAHPGVPFLVVLTDFADFPPHFWIEEGLDGVVVPTAEAADQARAAGLDAERIVLTSGTVLHPRFHRLDVVETRERVRRELGASEDDPVLVVLFGGKGSPEMAPLVRSLLEAHESWRVVAICGDNPALYARLEPIEAVHGPRLVRLGFTDRVAEYLAAADLLLSKPGPGSLAEAFHLRVPVVVIADSHTIPQERFNADYIARHELGLVVSHWREMPQAALALAASSERRAALRARLAARPPNAAVFELLEIFSARMRAAEPKSRVG